MHTSTLVPAQANRYHGIAQHAMTSQLVFLLPSRRKPDQNVVFSTKLCKLRLTHTPNVVLAGTGVRGAVTPVPTGIIRLGLGQVKQERKRRESTYIL